jgi:hypothetical protein
MSDRYSKLAETARGWSAELHRPLHERRQAMAIASISDMLHERRFPHECEVKVLRLLVCKLCGESGEGGRCLSESPRDCYPFLGGRPALATGAADR